MHRGLSFVVAVVVATVTVTVAAAAADVPRHIVGTSMPESHTVRKESSCRFKKKITSFLFHYPVLAGDMAYHTTI